MSSQHEGEAQLERLREQWAESQRQVAEAQRQAEQLRQQQAERQGGAK
ncbi:hypothetical protein [Kitasatospora sp. CB01950]|nr:hypothetical protein [Kitasatospora sp. CB01950]